MSGVIRPYPEYKDSGVPWLGEIPAHWEMTRVRYLFQEIDQRSEKGDETHLSMSQVHGLIESSKIDSWRLHSDSYVGGKLCRANDLVLNRLKAHLGVFAHASVDGLVSPDYSVYRLKNNGEVRFFELVFKTPAYVAELRRSTKGIVEGFWRLYTDDFYKVRVPVPPAHEQWQILAFLDALDYRVNRFIRAKRRLIELLNEQKQAIIHQAVTRGLDPDVPLKPSGVEWLGDVPEHWSIVPLRYLGTKFGSGSTPRGGASVYQASGIPFLRSQNVHFGELRMANVAYISDEVHQQMAGTHVQPQDVLLNITGASIGRVCSVPETLGAANVSQHVCIIRPIQSLISSEFLAHYLSIPPIQRHIRMTQTGASREGLPLDDLKPIRIVVPPGDEQRRIEVAISQDSAEIGEAINSASHEIVLIEEYRTRLIADVVTGTLDVRDVELPDLDGDGWLEEFSLNGREDGDLDEMEQNGLGIVRDDA